jgi:anionic cell wall polymer biosynthesis LytR-Cps2A-Psr (LCP) family protein
VPVTHYVEVEFAGLTSIVDALGGVPMTLPFPARDLTTGLNLPAGPQVLDGVAALAYVRSRQFQELDGSVWRTDPGDLSRIGRQQILLRSLLEILPRRCSSLSCGSALRDLGEALSVDHGFDSGDARHLLGALRRTGSGVVTATLPTQTERAPEDSVSPFPPAHPGSLGFRRLDQPAADAVLDRLRRAVTAPEGAGS